MGACAVPDGGLFRAARFRDVHLYEGFANAVFDGRVPYRDFFMEYPPGSLAVFLPPAAVVDHYNVAFKALMTLCGAATLVVVALLVARLRASTFRLWAVLLLVALSPIALGPISLNTYDAWPALLTVVALALLLAAQPVLAFALLGLAFAAKVYPVVLLPAALVFVWRTAGRAPAVRSLAAFGSVAALVVVPFLVLAPHGLAESFRAQAARGLQDESLGASFLGVADRLGWYSATVVERAGEAVSFELVGLLPRALPLQARSPRSVPCSSCCGSTSEGGTNRAVLRCRSRPPSQGSSPSRVSSLRSISSGSFRSSRCSGHEHGHWRPRRSCSPTCGSSTITTSTRSVATSGSFSRATWWSSHSSSSRSLRYAEVRRKTRIPSSSKTRRQSALRRSAASCTAVGKGA